MATKAVKVALRVRPHLENEPACRTCITITEDEPSIVIAADQEYALDYVFPPSTTQADLYARSIDQFLDRFAEGDHATILAYGQQGAGKTFSLDTGTDPQTEPGILRRLVNSLFEKIEKESAAGNVCQLFLSYLEVQSDDVFDCLEELDSTMPTDATTDMSNPYRPRWHWERLHSVVQFERGHRATDAKHKNSVPFRSHTVVSLLLKHYPIGHPTVSRSEPLVVGENDASDRRGQQRVSKLHLIDFAGSDLTQREPKNGSGERPMEADTNLVVLRHVMSALREQEPRVTTPHVRHDGSGELGQLLQESLDDQNHVLLLACVSPAEADAGASIETLAFAARAHTIQRARIAYHNDVVGKSNIDLDALQHATLRSVSFPGRHQHELTHVRVFAKQLADDLAAAQSKRDTLRLQLDSAATVHPAEIAESHPLIRQYVHTIQQLQLQIQEAHGRLAHLESNENMCWNEKVLLRPGITCSTALPGRFGCNVRRTFRLGSVSTGRRKSRHHVPIQFRMKRTGSHAIHSNASIVHDYGGTQTSVDPDKSGTYTAHMQTIDIFIWSQSEDETVVHGSAEEGQEARPPPPPSPPPCEACAAEPSGSCAEMQLLESHPSLLQAGEHDNELTALDVPSWADVPKTQSTAGSTKRESLSWTDSVIDDSDNSVIDSIVDGSEHSVATSRLSGTTRPEGGLRGRRRSKDLLKLLHQVQADMLVKKELIGQLEKSEDEYTQMRSTYEAKLSELQEHLVDLRRERGSVVRASQVTEGGARNGLQLREARETQQVRQFYEQKLKRLSVENQDLKKKHTQANHALHTARTKAETIVTRLRASVEALKLEKKQMQRAAKLEADKARDKLVANERDVQTLVRREAMLADKHKKLEETATMQAQLLKKRNDEVSTMSAQMRQLTASLRKAAGEGTLLNETALEKIMSALTSSSNNAGNNTNNNANNHTLHSPTKSSMRASPFLDA